MPTSYVYFQLLTKRSDVVKIGRAKSPQNRASDLRKRYGPLTALGFIREGVGLTENHIHKHFAHLRIPNEPGERELFKLTQELSSFINTYASKTVEEALPDSFVILE